jgi:hypothetical protein
METWMAWMRVMLECEFGLVEGWLLWSNDWNKHSRWRFTIEYNQISL